MFRHVAAGNGRSRDAPVRQHDVPKAFYAMLPSPGTLSGNKGVSRTLHRTRGAASGLHPALRLDLAPHRIVDDYADQP